MGKRSAGLIGVFALTALVAMVSASSSVHAQGTSVSLQIVNPSEGALVRVFLDRKLVYEGAPTKETLGNHGVMSVVVGRYDLADGRRHVLIAEAPGGHARTQFEWNPQRDASPWVVIRYHPGHALTKDDPSFIVALQEAAYKLK